MKYTEEEMREMENCLDVDCDLCPYCSTRIESSKGEPFYECFEKHVKDVNLESDISDKPLLSMEIIDAYCVRCASKPYLKGDDTELCAFCYSTQLGNILKYPRNYFGQETMTKGLVQSFNLLACSFIEVKNK